MASTPRLPRKQLAIEKYRKSVELDPKNQNDDNKLKEPGQK
jgi:hypothetical protein